MCAKSDGTFSTVAVFIPVMCLGLEEMKCIFILQYFSHYFLTDDKIQKCRTCEHSGCLRTNVCHVAFVSTAIAMPSFLSVLQPAPMLPS